MRKLKQLSKSGKGRGNFEMVVSLSRQRWILVLILFCVLYWLFLIGLQVPFDFSSGFSSISQEPVTTVPYNNNNNKQLKIGEESQLKAPSRPLKQWVSSPDSDSPTQTQLTPTRSSIKSKLLSNISFDAKTFTPSSESGVFQLHKVAKTAFEVGRKLWEELESGNIHVDTEKRENLSESCPRSIILSGSEFLNNKNVMILPCGLTLGSHITIVGFPREAHEEKKELMDGQEAAMVSEFMMELRGLKMVEGEEEPPRILHFNPRLKGDFSGKPVIEQNTCYRMQWGTALRCQGSPSGVDEETVDGKLKCEKWISDDENHPEQTKNKRWLQKRLRPETKMVTSGWLSPFPFEEGRLFVLTLLAGLEGYHVNVDGKHVTSFPYHPGFTLEDATGLALDGDIDVHDIFAASLPTTHPSSGTQTHLEMQSRWQAPPLPVGPVELFIGILSAGNHFAERMAVRKSWMQHKLVQSSNVVVRFFVALHAMKEENVELKKEAEYFGDIVVVPYMDNYDLVVLKTVAICEYGARTLSAKHIMKCDDDTFVRLDAVIDEVKNVPDGKSLYIGNINYYHKPLRHGKWAVTYEEWPEEDYPPYANGPGYILSSDIALSIVSDFESQKIRLFKMEDVSMGVWVEQFNGTKPVEYINNLKFCQFGCIEGYYTAHYQSPRQMICLWNKLQTLGKAQCCDTR